jgi:hypothetical protein
LVGWQTRPAGLLTTSRPASSWRMANSFSKRGGKFNHEIHKTHEILTGTMQMRNRRIASGARRSRRFDFRPISRSRTPNSYPC